MSKFVRIAQTSQSLSLAAMEEASRQGLREADLEHLFLALVLSDQSAGRVLRDLGVSIDTARRAVHEQHEAQLASLGVTTGLPEPGRIVFHETGGYEWSQRAAELIGRAGGKSGDGSAAAVLRELVTEPSGLIEELLARLDLTRATVLDALDRLAPTSDAAERRSGKGQVVGSTETFVPGSIENVWDFLADPARIPEWEPGIGSVDLTDAPAVPGTFLTGHAPVTRPDGKPVKLKAEFRRRGIELLGTRHPEQVTWRFTSPDTDKCRPIVTAFALAPTTGGTQVTITMCWSRYQGWRRLLGIPLRPAQKFLIWITLFQIGSAISRTFR